jgi:AraC-like DNA-binding protein
MNPSNIVEFTVPVEDSESPLVFIHYREDITQEKSIDIKFHEFIGFGLNLTSQLEYVINEKSHQVKKNQYQIIYTTGGHCKVTLAPGHHSVILIKLPPNFLNNFSNAIFQFQDLFSSAKSDTSPDLNEPMPIPYQAHGLLDQIFTYQNRDLQETYLYIKIVEMVALFFDQITSRKSSVIKDDLLVAIQHAQKVIQKNVQKNWSLDLLAATVNLSRKKLILGFKKYFDMSPIQYVYNQRLNKALTLLRDTNLSIIDISIKVGYKHPQNFSQAFSKKFGHPPKSYRPLTSSSEN